MKHLRIVMLLLICCTFLGCPYYSDVPLSGKRYKIGDFLVGKWKQCPEDGSCKYLLITQHTDYEYNLSYKSYNAYEEKWRTITKRAHLSKVGSDWYLNTKLEDEYQVSKVIQYTSSLYIYGLSQSAFTDNNDNEIKFKTSAEFCDYVNFYSPKSELFLSPKVFEKY